MTTAQVSAAVERAERRLRGADPFAETVETLTIKINSLDATLRRLREQRQNLLEAEERKRRVP